MNRQFNHGQLSQDFQDFTKFISGFLKSFGPSQKKMGEVPFSPLQIVKTWIILGVVEGGISKAIRTGIFLVVGIILLATVFFRVDATLKIVIALGYLFFYAWLFMDHLQKDGKPVSFLAGHLITLHEKRLETQDAVGGAVSGVVTGVFNSFGNFIPSGSSGSGGDRTEAPKA